MPLTTLVDALPTLALAGEQARFTVDLLVVLAAAAALAMLGQRLRLAIIPAYLITGVFIGPHALGWVQSPQSLDAIGQLAIILLLFGIGLELNLAIIKHDLLRMVIAGLLSCGACILAGWPVAMFFGLSAPAALAVAIAMGTSSTAVVLRTLDQRRELTQTRGRLAIAMTTLQDLMVLGLLPLFPALRAWKTLQQGPLPTAADPAIAGSAIVEHAADHLAPTLAQAAGWDALPVWIQIAISAAILAGLFIVGRLLLPRLMAESARHHSNESMMILSIAVAIGSAMVTEWLGFGAALGAFIAGFILATTTFRYQLRGQVIPLRNLFLAVFLTTLGMQMDPVSLLRWWWLILLGVAALTLVKAVATGLTCWAVGATGSVAVAVALALAQGGEFSLVILTIGRDAGLLGDDATGIAIAVVVLSLVITPGLIRAGYYFAQHPLWSRPAPWLRSTPLRDAIPADQPQPRPHVIIAGFGPVGRAIADRLEGTGIEMVMVELNPVTVQKQTRLGRNIIFGDVSNPEILEAANVRQASALVVTIPDPDAAVRTCAVARSMQPDLFIAVRTNIVSQAMLARAAGADHVTVEELATAESMQQAVIARILAQGGEGMTEPATMASTPACRGDAQDSRI